MTRKVNLASALIALLIASTSAKLSILSPKSLSEKFSSNGKL